MLRIVNVDKVYGVVTIEIAQEEVQRIMESVDSMIEKQRKTLLENLPTEDQVRQRLDEYNALKEQFRKVWDSLVQ
ncbi:MAG TPA: hypothetical protein VH415_16680 [Nitrososphaeraceae archaeon]|jgi:hypothetical protein